MEPARKEWTKLGFRVRTQDASRGLRFAAQHDQPFATTATERARSRQFSNLDFPSHQVYSLPQHFRLIAESGEPFHVRLAAEPGHLTLRIVAVCLLRCGDGEIPVHFTAQHCRRLL